MPLVSGRTPPTVKSDAGPACSPATSCVLPVVRVAPVGTKRSAGRSPASQGTVRQAHACTDWRNKDGPGEEPSGNNSIIMPHHGHGVQQYDHSRGHFRIYKRIIDLSSVMTSIGVTNSSTEMAKHVRFSCGLYPHCAMTGKLCSPGRRPGQALTADVTNRTRCRRLESSVIMHRKQIATII